MTALVDAGPRARSRGDLLDWASRALANAGSASAPLDATVLLSWLLKAPATQVAADRHEVVSGRDVESYASLVERRAEGEPVAYITGYQRFMGLDLLADRRALLVRPLTAVVGEIAQEIVRVRQRDGIVAADVGTGCGALAVALALLEPTIARLYATDVSAAALTLARANARRYRVDDRVIAVEGDLLQPVPEPLDLIVANLPYVPTSALAGGAAGHEPELAFDGGDDGLGVLRRFVAQLPARLNDGGAVVMEIGPGQRAPVAAALAAAVPNLRILAQMSQSWAPCVVVGMLAGARSTLPGSHPGPGGES